MTSTQKSLIMTVGLPRSGKSTWSRSMSYPIVNPDSIRLALHGQAWQPLAEGFVWAIAKIMVRALFLAGHNAVVLDSTNINRRRRDEWKSKDWSRHYIEFETSEATCLERAVSSGREDLIPVIKKMALDYQPLEEDEIDLTKSEDPST